MNNAAAKRKSALDNVTRALTTLEEFASISAPSRVEKAGIIQAFEFTFEVFWKFFKKIADEEGAVVASPKTAIAFAYQKRWLGDDELAQDVWLSMLDDRSLTSHTYREAIANAVHEAIVHRYVCAFRDALTRIEA
jgi:nucleotidyltransferase substrate binding protein (TIGR01987 family)